MARSAKKKYRAGLRKRVNNSIRKTACADKRPLHASTGLSAGRCFSLVSPLGPICGHLRTSKQRQDWSVGAPLRRDGNRSAGRSHSLVFGRRRSARGHSPENRRSQLGGIAFSVVSGFKESCNHVGDRKIHAPRTDLGHCGLQDPVEALQLIRTVTVDFHGIASSPEVASAGEKADACQSAGTRSRRHINMWRRSTVPPSLMTFLYACEIWNLYNRGEFFPKNLLQEEIICVDVVEIVPPKITVLRRGEVGLCRGAPVPSGLAFGGVRCTDQFLLPLAYVRWPFQIRRLR